MNGITLAHGALRIIKKSTIKGNIKTKITIKTTKHNTHTNTIITTQTTKQTTSHNQNSPAQNHTTPKHAPET